jgi:hypothetical protein
MPELILNPKTNRFVKVGGPKYKRLVKEGFITPNAETPEPVETSDPVAEKEPEPVGKELPAPKPVCVKSEMAVVAVDLVKKHESQFVDLSKAETSKLLRKLLIDKLAPKTPKKKKKSKYKLRTPPPSSSDESSDSD